jgi:uncharacterized protein (DUF952 family)
LELAPQLGINYGRFKRAVRIDRFICRIIPLAHVHKLLTQSAWDEAVAAGTFLGASIDLADGYIHLSTDTQTRETARRYFTQGDDIVLVTFDDSTLTGLKYEPSRGGDLFPHVYGAIATASALRVLPLARGADGLLMFPDDIA